MEIYVMPCLMFLLNFAVVSITAILVVFIASFVYSFMYAYFIGFTARIREFKRRMNGKDV